MSNTNLIPAERIERRILLLRGQKVLLDFQLAELYEIPAKVLNQSVKRNTDRFPADFMFQLSEEETLLVMRSQIVTSSGVSHSQATRLPPSLMSQMVTPWAKKRRLTHRPYAFTEQGVAMLSSILRSPRAVQVNIAIMRTFVQLRQMIASSGELARKLSALEAKYDKQFKVVFDAIRELMEDSKPLRRGEIGFHTAMPTRRPKMTAARKS